MIRTALISTTFIATLTLALTNCGKKDSNNNDSSSSGSGDLIVAYPTSLALAVFPTEEGASLQLVEDDTKTIAEKKKKLRNL